jgi:beta-xylosidase
MYYTARDASAGKQCVSYAVASSPAGPFEDANDEPFICQRDLGGSIDPSPFVDSDGRRYLLWKNDGNCCGITTSIWIAELAPDGRSLRGKPRDVGASNDQTWEGRVVEGPNLVLHDGTYYLFYSANDYASAFYAVGYATSRTVTGPYTDAAENPILATKGRAAGPGGQTVVEGRDGRAWMLYHAWDIDAIGDQAGGERSLWLDRLEFVDGKAVVHGPTDTAQPEPMP